MPNIHLETFIAAPIETCFDLLLTIETHEQTGHGHAIAGTTACQLKLGDTVTWEATHFGTRQRLTSKITAYDRPYMFVDEMQQGAFQHWRHTHYFVAQAGGTLMTEDADFASPFGIIGKIFDALVLKNYMTRFLLRGNAQFKRLAEGRQEARQRVEPVAVANKV